MSVLTLSVKIRHRGLTIDGSDLAELYYASLNLPEINTVDPFLSAEDETFRQGSLNYQKDKGRLAARRFASRYVQDVIDLLGQIDATKTGNAVLEAIRRSPMGDGITIVPYIKEPDAKPNAGAMAIEPVGKATSPGGPKDAMIEFTPSNWRRNDSFAEPLKSIGIEVNDDWGPGALPDEVLLHELVHALFITTGKQLKRRVPLQGRRYLTTSRNPKYPDWRDPFEMDEFMAIMITNIYHSERGRRFIRHSHTDHVAHDITDTQFLDFGMNRAHIRLLRRKQPELFGSLNDVKASWNPLRQFRDAL